MLHDHLVRVGLKALHLAATTSTVYLRVLKRWVLNTRPLKELNSVSSLKVKLKIYL